MMVVPLEVFCCYAREDQEMLEHLKKHLMPLQRSGQITVWSDTNLNAGVEWKKELHRHLESADLILLLISPDFMNSDYCYSVEMMRAIERHTQESAHVIPILLRPVHWDTAPFAKLQMIPTNAIPVTRWSDHDDAFHDITGHIKRFIAVSGEPIMAPIERFTKHEDSGKRPAPSSNQTATLIITRRTDRQGGLRSLSIYFDDQKVGTVRNGASFTLEVQEGHHTLLLRLNWISSRSLSFDIASGERMTFLCQVTLDESSTGSILLWKQ